MYLKVEDELEECHAGGHTIDVGPHVDGVVLIQNLGPIKEPCAN